MQWIQYNWLGLILKDESLVCRKKTSFNWCLKFEIDVWNLLARFVFGTWAWDGGFLNVQNLSLVDVVDVDPLLLHRKSYKLSNNGSKIHFEWTFKTQIFLSTKWILCEIKILSSETPNNRSWIIYLPHEISHHFSFLVWLFLEWNMNKRFCLQFLRIYARNYWKFLRLLLFLFLSAVPTLQQRAIMDRFLSRTK